MALLPLLLDACAVHIQDETFCALVPGDYGAVCDNFLTTKPQTLTKAQWDAMQNSWNAQGYAVECTTSKAIGDIKTEIEQLCSVTRCDYEVEKKILDGLNRMQGLALTGLRF